MQTRIAAVCLLLAGCAWCQGPGCQFEFETAGELEDFDLICNGAVGNWTVEEILDSTNPPLDHGSGAVTSKLGLQACMKSKKAVTLPASATVTMQLYFNSDIAAALTLDVKLVGPSQEYEWKVGDMLPGGRSGWFAPSHVFENTEDTYKLMLLLYRSGKSELLIDNVDIPNIISDSDECYSVPKTSTSTTTESTTTESTTTESTTVESTTTESTTVESTTTESTTVESTTTESTTVESTTAESTTAESTTAESTTADSTTVESTTADSTTVDSTTADSKTTDSGTTESTSPQTVTSTAAPLDDTLSFSYYYYMAAVIISSGVLALAAVIACACAYRKEIDFPGKRSKLGVEGPRTSDEELYRSVSKAWNRSKMA